MSLRYEIVFDCRDPEVGARLAGDLEAVVGAVPGVLDVQRVDDQPPTWGVLVTFRDGDAVERYFASAEHRGCCAQVRRAARSSVLVVPLGATQS